MHGANKSRARCRGGKPRPASPAEVPETNEPLRRLPDLRLPDITTESTPEPAESEEPYPGREGRARELDPTFPLQDRHKGESGTGRSLQLNLFLTSVSINSGSSACPWADDCIDRLPETRAPCLPLVPGRLPTQRPDLRDETIFRGGIRK